MKIKPHIYFLMMVWVFSSTPLLGVSQHLEEVPNHPQKIRKLPDNFKEEYTGDAYDYVETTSWFARARQWLIERLVNWLDINSASATETFNVLKYLFYSLVILGVVYLIIKIILNKEARWIFKKNRKKENLLNFEITDNIQEVDFDTLIKNAVTNKDFRSAIRYYYLLLLKKLDEFDVITFDAQKTAFDYQMEVEGSKYAENFNKATRYYTYVWYGEFFIDEEEYETTTTVYQQLLKHLAK